jgi:hypothetical protein
LSELEELLDVDSKKSVDDELIFILYQWFF